MESIYTNPRLLQMTENNKENICNAIKDEWLDADAIGKIIGVSRSRASVLCRILGEEGYVKFEEQLRRLGADITRDVIADLS